MPDEKFEVRDLRNQEWLWTSKKLLFHKNVDEKMYKVYSGLAAFSDNKTQAAFPSILTLKDKLHMGRNTVIRALQKLEKFNFIKVSRKTGESNVYYLLDIKGDIDVVEEKTIEPEEPQEQPQEKQPKVNTSKFFKGIRDLNDKIESEEAINVRQFLQALKEKYKDAPKEIVWSEIKKFERYWTEKNQTGTKERWQKQDTFEVDRRLSKWFDGKKFFVKKVDIINRNKTVV